MNKTPEQYAKDLVKSYREFVDFTNDDGYTSYVFQTARAVKCALIDLENTEIILENNYGQDKDLSLFFLEVRNELKKIRYE